MKIGFAKRNNYLSTILIILILLILIGFISFSKPKISFVERIPEKSVEIPTKNTDDPFLTGQNMNSELNCIIGNNYKYICQTKSSFNNTGNIVAIFIALCALGVSIWQGVETRKNYRLSVTPKLSIDTDWISGSDEIGISVRNKGIGPAIIQCIEFEKDNQLFKSKSTVRDYSRFIAINYLSGTNITTYNWDLFPDEALAVGETANLYCLNNAHTHDVDKILQFRKILVGTRIRIEYKSIYEKEFFVERILDN
jgi:hypothetical protein